MTVLSDRNILGYLAEGKLEIREPHPEILQPASVDLHLSRRLRTVTSTIIDPMSGKDVGSEAFTMDGGWLLNPGAFVLGSTQEWVRIPPDLVAIITGKSSLARIGLQVEAAGYADPGFMGNLTLELYNMGPAMIILRPGMEVCQLRFDKLSSEPLHLYGDPILGSHYRTSVGTVPARFGRQVVLNGPPDGNVPLVGQTGSSGIEPPTSES